MEPLHANARDQFFTAIRTLAASPDTIQTRVTDASKAILQITIDEFEGDVELKIRFARLLDLLAIDEGELEKAAGENGGSYDGLRSDEGRRFDV